ncbi:hypothetical protein B0T20DRAFT_419396 [Sordaria brevicollis]|uniref:Uncharacterized protein n=1 Tax=Sordaria brevicollis TaxID=83679 RepID=A0AAE0U977_SORBR|nr:hypothetical protein B0T20DRAFT_419396 [Sordaria brevicollis]
MTANSPHTGQDPTDDVNMTDAHSDHQQQPTQQQHHHLLMTHPDRPPHPVSPVPIPQIPGRPSPTAAAAAHPTANQGPSSIRGAPTTTNGYSTTEPEQSQQQRTGSRAASAHPQEQQQAGGGGTGTGGMPTEPTLHGAPVRQYLNSKVTVHLLEGMKMLAKEQPKDPLRALGEYLLQRSKQYEQGGGGGGGGGANGNSNATSA